MEQRCINRNIVECKVIYHNAKFSHELVLIETLWNVKQKDGAYFKATDRY